MSSDAFEMSKESFLGLLASLTCDEERKNFLDWVKHSGEVS